MLEAEFTSIFAEFNHHYGNIYGDREFNRVFQIAQPMEPGSFQDELDKLIDHFNARRPPSVNDIREQLREPAGRAHAANVERLIDGQPLCSFCAKTGIVQVYTDFIEKGTTQALSCGMCKCARIRKLSKEFVEWRIGKTDNRTGQELLPVIPDVQIKGRKLREEHALTDGQKARLSRIFQIVSEASGPGLTEKMELSRQRQAEAASKLKAALATGNWDQSVNQGLDLINESRRRQGKEPMSKKEFIKKSEQKFDF